MAHSRSKMATLGMKDKRHKGPLREVETVLRYGVTLFDTDSVVFVCGHTGERSPGAIRGRCRKCDQINKGDTCA